MKLSIVEPVLRNLFISHFLLFSSVSHSSLFCLQAVSQAPIISEKETQDWNSSLTNLFSNPDKIEELTVFSYTESSGLPDLERSLSSSELAKSVHHPVDIPIFLSNRFGGGSSVFNLDVFANDFFLRKTKKTNLTSLTTQQPWFEWVSSQKQFIYHPSGAHFQILKNLIKEEKEIILYRGTHQAESGLLKLIARISRDPIVHNEISTSLRQIEREIHGYQIAVMRMKSKKKAVADARFILDEMRLISQAFANFKMDPLELRDELVKILKKWIKRSSFKSLFTSPSKMYASLFAKGSLVSFKLSSDELIQLGKKPNSLFVGIEGDVEISFISDEAVNAYIAGFVDSEVHAGQKIWN